MAKALGRLQTMLGRSLRVASLFRTAPASALPQPDFLNTAAIGLTRLPADALLGLAKALEYSAGRRPGPRDGPRPLDIDLLLYGDRVSDAPELTLPHPRLTERRFVLAPLTELAAGWKIPPYGTSVSAALDASRDASAIERIGWSSGVSRELREIQ